MSEKTHTEPPVRRTSIVGNVLRGALIGTVETIPGVSGGTVALVVGIYEQLIDSASELISAIKALILGPDRRAQAAKHFRAVHWNVVIPVGIAAILAVLTVAGPMSHLYENHPTQMRGLFFGMVLASIAVPVQMIRRNMAQRRAALAMANSDPQRIRFTGWHALAGLIGFLAVFILTSLPGAHLTPNPAVIIIAAAIAVSALVLPGLSGSFLLLTFGLYEPTLSAVDERDFGYLGIFLIGIAIGLVFMVKLLKWLLEHHHALTLTVLTGVMAGGLRTLWPWQTADGALAAPGESLGVVLLFFVIGFIAVSALVVLDNRLAKRQGQLH